MKNHGVVFLRQQKKFTSHNEMIFCLYDFRPSTQRVQEEKKIMQCIFCFYITHFSVKNSTVFDVNKNGTKRIGYIG